MVGEEFDAFFVISVADEKEYKERGDTCFDHPAADIVHLRWDVRNGPSARVSLHDTHANDQWLANPEFPIVDIDAEEDSRWSLKDWGAACSKINSRGCDVLTAKIERKWDYGNFIKHAETDLDFNGKTFAI